MARGLDNSVCARLARSSITVISLSRLVDKGVQKATRAGAKS